MRLDRGLPPELTAGAQLRGNEYAWGTAAFPAALMQAPHYGYACLGGQFQFRLPEGTCEMYWLNADSSGRKLDEHWHDYCRRCCAEVLEAFLAMLKSTDFRAEAANWPSVRELMAPGSDPAAYLVFQADFVDESEYVQLTSAK